MEAAGDKVNELLHYAFAGASFVFGRWRILAEKPDSFSLCHSATIVFMAAFFALLYHLASCN